MSPPSSLSYRSGAGFASHMPGTEATISRVHLMHFLPLSILVDSSILVTAGGQEVEFPIRKTASEPNLKVKSMIKQKLSQDRRNSPLMTRRRQFDKLNNALSGLSSSPSLSLSPVCLSPVPLSPVRISPVSLSPPRRSCQPLSSLLLLSASLLPVAPVSLSPPCRSCPPPHPLSPLPFPFSLLPLSLLLPPFVPSPRLSFPLSPAHFSMLTPEVSVNGYDQLNASPPINLGSTPAISKDTQKAATKRSFEVSPCLFIH